MNKWHLYYGMDTPLPVRVPLRAGPLSLVYENGDLRYIRLGNTPVLLRVYWAVRDRNWGTVPTTLSNVQIATTPESFQINYDARCQDPAHEIDFRARVALVGSPDGAISAVMDGTAQHTFLRNRLGFCVLHPAAQASRACVVEHVDGRSERAKLPNLIYAHQPVEPFSEMRGLRVRLTSAVWADMRFEGDTFEMEDQRNWTDASFKTFCTPLRLPFPVEVPQGAVVRQTVALHLVGESGKLEGKSGKLKVERAEGGAIHFSVLSAAGAMPAVGLGQAVAGKALTKTQVSRLQALKLKHLRVDLDLGDVGLARELKRAAKDARALGVSLEMALFIDPQQAESQLRGLRTLLAKVAPPVGHWLIYPARESQVMVPPVLLLLAAARKHLGDYNRQALFASGTDADFIFANKQAQAFRNVKALDAFCTCSNPQLHAFDNASLTETLATQVALVKSARKLAQGKPVLITPITLRPRWNPYSTGAVDKGAPMSDGRQASLFGAGWLLGSLKYLVEAGAASATYFETVGERGVLMSNVFPMYHVLADVAEFSAGVGLASRSAAPLKVDGLALRIGTGKRQRTRLLLANMTDEPQVVSLSELGQTVTIKRLDETNAALAMASPEKYRAQAGEVTKTVGGKLTLNVLPYAYIKIDY